MLTLTACFVSMLFYSTVRVKRLLKGGTPILPFLKEESVYFLHRYCRTQNEEMKGWLPEVKPSNFGSFVFSSIVDGKVSLDIRKNQAEIRQIT